LKDKEVPLCLYFSIMTSLKKSYNSKTIDITKFKEKINLYEKIKNKEVYDGDFMLALMHDESDPAHSYTSTDNFNPEADKILMNIQLSDKNLTEKEIEERIQIFRHNATNRETVESMFNRIQNKKGNGIFPI
jgi:hypothetical protein